MATQSDVALSSSSAARASSSSNAASSPPPSATVDAFDARETTKRCGAADLLLDEPALPSRTATMPSAATAPSFFEPDDCCSAS